MRRPEKKIQGLRKRGRGVRDELSGISIGHSTSSLQRKWTKSGPCVFISVSSIKYDPFSFNKAKSTCYDYSWAGIYVVRYVDSKLEVYNLPGSWHATLYAVYDRHEIAAVLLQRTVLQSRVLSSAVCV